MYFSTPNKIIYDNMIVADITKRVNIVQNLLKNIDFYFDHEIREGQTPETVAFDFYGTTDYHWIILLMNEVYDPFYDWYMSYREVVEYSKLKYGDPDYTYTRHWEKDGVVYQEDPGQGVAVTNLEYEVRINDAKQTIKLVYPEYVNLFISQYKNLVK